MQQLAPYIKQAYDHTQEDSSPTLGGQIFAPPQSTPLLDSTQINRILVYPGSFNPPHRGHLQLLNHAFYHGVHDLNVVAAIVLPSSDESVKRKCDRHASEFWLGRNERCFLWKRDPCFPEWAWVYEGRRFNEFCQHLRSATSEDGYKVKFVCLYGPDQVSPYSAPGTGELTLFCDAGRSADYQRSCGRLKNFVQFTNWGKVKIDKEQLRQLLKTKAQLALAAVEMTLPVQAQKILEECPDYIEKVTQARLAAASRDLQNVIHCTEKYGGKATLRFIKYTGDGSTRGGSIAADEGTVTTNKPSRRKTISSTKLRMAMCNQKGTKLKASLLEMALSPETLWWYSPIWLSKARDVYGRCIKFLSSCPPETWENLLSKPDTREDMLSKSSSQPSSEAFPLKNATSSTHPPGSKDDRDLRSRKRRLSVAFPAGDTITARPATRRRAASL